MTTHSSILAWKTPWTDEPGRLQSMGSQRVGHDSWFIYRKPGLHQKTIRANKQIQRSYIIKKSTKKNYLFYYKVVTNYQ